MTKNRYDPIAPLRSAFLMAAAKGDVAAMRPYLAVEDPAFRPMTLISAFAPAIARGHKEACLMIMEEAPRNNVPLEELGFFADEAGQSRLFARLLLSRI